MLPYLFVLLAIAVRFLPFAGPLNILPHAWHFTPLAASLLFFGARGSRRQMWIPLVLFAATDVVLTKFIYSAPLGWDQLGSVAGNVSTRLQRPDDVLHRRHSVLPRDVRK
jgi:hypothetical protein